MRIPITETCPKCNGFGFDKFGSGYDAVCEECAGQGEILVGWKEKEDVMDTTTTIIDEVLKLGESVIKPFGTYSDLKDFIMRRKCPADFGYSNLCSCSFRCDTKKCWERPVQANQGGR